MVKSSRIIKDIESIDQAIKAEENVEGGYHKTIDEYLTYWMAVEEDVVESYTRLAETMQNTNVRKTLGQLIEDSKMVIASPTAIADRKKKNGSRGEYQNGCSFSGMIR